MTKKKRTRLGKEIRDYDRVDSFDMIDASKPLKFRDLGLILPETPPTQVISIRLPSALLNDLRAIGSQRDIPYQALIKLFLSQSVAETKKRLE